jgi:N-acetylmuramic acid 6-phosphate etherase
MHWDPSTQLNPSTSGISKWTTAEIVDFRIAEIANVQRGLGEAKPNLVKAAEIIADALMNGGRIVTIGAGGAGIAGMALIREIPQNHRLLKPEQMLYRVAGGRRVFEPFGCEELEDDENEGRHDIAELALGRRDVVICLSRLPPNSFPV